MPPQPTDKIRDAIRVYFAANGFKPDGGYTDDFVVLKIGPIPLAFPNTKRANARCRTTTFTTS